MDNAGLIEEVRYKTSKKLGDIEAELAARDGVRSVNCDTDNNVVVVRYDPTVIDRNLIKDVVESGAGRAELLGDLPGSDPTPAAGIDAGYGPANRSPATQGQPPSSTV
jgi:hypothetical protein